MSRGRRTDSAGEDEVLERLRAFCLSLPETSERASWGHPNFVAGKKTFVTFERVRERPSIAFRLGRPDIEGVIRDGRFFETPYGRGQWVSVWVDADLDWSFVRQLVGRAYRLVALRRMIDALNGGERG